MRFSLFFFFLWLFLFHLTRPEPDPSNTSNSTSNSTYQRPPPSGTFQPYFIVRVHDAVNTSVKVKELDAVVYFLLNSFRIARPVLSIETIQSFYFDPNNLENVSFHHMKHHYRVLDEPIPLMRAMDPYINPDQAMQYHIQKSLLFHGDLVLPNQTETIGVYGNPALSLFRNRLLLSTSLSMTLPTANSKATKKQENKHVEFRFFNHTDFSFYSKGAYLGIEDAEIEGLDKDILGEDVRVLVVNDTFVQVFFTDFIWGYHRQHMGLAELTYNPASDKMEVSFYCQRMSWYYGENPGSNQKNWSPFWHVNETLLVQSINPLVVVRMSSYRQEDMWAEVLSETSFVDHAHEEQLRGGSNAVWIGDRYLSFYHTRSRLMGSPMFTYFMGAYTFSADPPFYVLSVSPGRIVPAFLYQGQWQGRFMDYVVYPTSLFLVNDTLYLTFGYQDKFGMLSKLSLSKLLLTMTPVHHKHLGKPNVDS